MGKAGYLPDISGRFNFWTNYAVRCLSFQNIDGAISGLNNMNALLDEDHRITVSTREYEAQILSDRFYQCNFCTDLRNETVNAGTDEEFVQKIECPTEIGHSQIHVFELVPTYYESVITKHKKNRVWICPKCKHMNKISQTEIIKPEREKPYYLKVVPDPPKRTSSNRVGFEKLFNEYFNNFSEELENAIMLYRVDYIAEHGEDMGDISFFKDKGDLK